MIFNLPGHIPQIRAGTKTQTRRLNNQYLVGHSYAVQSNRGEKALNIRILIKRKWLEERRQDGKPTISEADAQAEGGYSAAEYERLYDLMYPGWVQRTAYEFEAIITKPTVQAALS